MPPGPTALPVALARLVPWPEDGSRADGPVAVDATDRLLLHEVQPWLERVLAVGHPARPPAVVIGDRFGALTVGLGVLGVPALRVHTDAVTAESAIRHNLSAGHGAPAAYERVAVEIVAALTPDLVRDARLVLLQLPRSLGELQEIAELVAREAADDVVLLAGGRVKHMTPAMNEVLAAAFREVRATLARGKSRALVASRPRPEARQAAPSFPAAAVLHDAELLAATGRPGQRGVAVVDPSGVTGRTTLRGIAVVAHGGVFAGATLDLGTRSLLRTVDGWPTPSSAVDLGCGTGLLATVLALRSTGTHVVATDRSAAAVASARATAVANGVGDRVTTLRSDAGAGIEDASVDLVLCNPPFHDRAAVTTDAAHRMFATAARILRPGGELWCVYNSVLRYRPALERTVGPTTQAARDTRFTVTRSVRREHANALPRP